MSVKYNSKILKEVDQKEQLEKLEELKASVNKRQIAELFEQGLKCDAFKPAMWCDTLQFNYSFGDYNYSLVRCPHKGNKKAMDFLKYRQEQYQKYQQEAVMKGATQQLLKDNKRYNALALDAARRGKGSVVVKK